MKYLNPFAWCVLIVLVGCATLTGSERDPLNQHMSWDRRQAQLAAIETWSIQGIIGIQTYDNVGSASLSWDRHPESYQIRLFGPLGANNTVIRGKPGHIEMQLVDGEVHRAKDPESLLVKHLGWYIPVSNLVFWIRGLPAPRTPAKIIYDEYHHITSMEQNQWNIQYLQYTSIGVVDLPRTLVLTREKLKVRILIHLWQSPI